MQFRQLVIWNVALVCLLGTLAGCHQMEKLPAPHKPHPTPPSPPAAEAMPKLTAKQIADLQMALGLSLEKQNKFQDAMTTYKKALENDPKRYDAAARLAVLHDRQANFAQSETLHRKALEAQPKQPDYLCNFGYSLYLQEKWEEAEKNFRKALDHNPKHSRACNNLGLVLLRLGRDKEAVAAFQKAGMSEADIQVNLAFAKALEKNWEKAGKHYQMALEKNPSSPVAKKGLARMNQMLARETTPSPALKLASGPGETAAPPPKQLEIILPQSLPIGEQYPDITGVNLKSLPALIAEGQHVSEINMGSGFGQLPNTVSP